MKDEKPVWRKCEWTREWKESRFVCVCVCVLFVRFVCVYVRIECMRLVLCM